MAAPALVDPLCPPSLSDEERINYFRGLGSCPELLARTGRDSWPPRLDADVPVPRKFFDRLQDEILVEKWAHQLNDLSAALIGVLEGCNWLHFYPIRIAYEQWATTPDLGSGVVLLVGVEGQIKHYDAHHRVVACKQILSQFGIDIEVEMYRTERHWYASQQDTEPKPDWSDVKEHELDPCFWRHITNDEKLARHGPINGILNPLIHTSLSYPVVSICGVVGSMGVHIKLDGSDHIFGLTCRHVAMGIRQDIECEDYVYEPYVAEWDKREVKTPTRTAEEALGKLAGMYVEALSDTTDESQIAIRDYIRKLPDGSTLGCSTVGHVVVSPPISAGYDGYFQDWALVQIADPEDSRVDLGNKVWVEREAYPWSGEDDTPSPDADPMDHDQKFPTDPDGFMALQEPLSVNEVLQWPIRVAMRGGAKNHLTYGFTSEIPAVVRLEPQANDGKLPLGEKVARQIIVIPPHSGSSKDACRQHTFAQPGDSGSVVFDGKGNILGLVGGGATGPGIVMDASRHLKDNHDEQTCLVCGLSMGHDITFVNPMEAIVNDVQARTGKGVIFVKTGDFS